MGGSAIGGDLVAGIWSDRLTVPLEVVRGYDLPAWVGRDTLVIASSKSGGTEETISALTAALERRCSCRGPDHRRAAPGRGPPGRAAARDVPGPWDPALVGGLFDGAPGGHPRACRRPAARRGRDARRRRRRRGRWAHAVRRRSPARRTPPSSSPGRSWTATPSSSAAASWPRSRGAGRPSSTRTARPRPPSRSFPRRPTTRSSASSSPIRCATTSSSSSWRARSDHPRNALRATLIGELLDEAGVSHQAVTATGEGRLGQALSAHHPRRPRERLRGLRLRRRPQSGGRHRPHQGAHGGRRPRGQRLIPSRRAAPDLPPTRCLLGGLASLGGQGPATGRGGCPGPARRRQAAAEADHRQAGGGMRCTPASSARSRRRIATRVSATASPWSASAVTFAGDNDAHRVEPRGRWLALQLPLLRELEDLRPHPGPAGDPRRHAAREGPDLTLPDLPGGRRGRKRRSRPRGAWSSSSARVVRTRRWPAPAVR